MTTPIDILLSRVEWKCPTCGEPTHPPKRCPCQWPRVGDVVYAETTEQIYFVHDLHEIRNSAGEIVAREYTGNRWNPSTAAFTARHYRIYGPTQLVWRRKKTRRKKNSANSH